MPAKKEFKVVDLLALYFGKAMSDDSSGSLKLLDFLLKLTDKADRLPYNILKLQALLKVQALWLDKINLTYYEKSENATINFYQPTEEELRRKRQWINKILEEHGETIKLRRFTDIEKAFLGY